MPVVESPVKATGEILEVSFGSGPFSKLMGNYFNKAQEVLAFPAPKAEKFARQLGSDLGAINKDMHFDVSAGKPDKDMFRKLSMSAKTGKIRIPPSVEIMVALQWIYDAYKNGVSFQSTKWMLIPALQEWVDKL